MDSVVFDKRFFDLTKDKDDDTLIEAVNDLNNSPISEQSFLRTLSKEIFGDDYLTSMIALAPALAILLGERLRRRNYILRSIAASSANNVKMIEKELSRSL